MTVALDDQAIIITECIDDLIQANVLLALETMALKAPKDESLEKHKEAFTNLALSIRGLWS